VDFMKLTHFNEIQCFSTGHVQKRMTTTSVNQEWWKSSQISGKKVFRCFPKTCRRPFQFLLVETALP